MTWTYTASSAGFQAQLNKVRREIGDVVTTDQLLSDEEIAYAGLAEGDDLSTAARCCEWIAVQLGRKADMEEGKLKITLSQRAKSYNLQALRLRSQANSGTAIPYSGGISISDKEANDEDTDRVPSGMWRGMSDSPDSILATPESTNTDDD